MKKYKILKLTEEELFLLKELTLAESSRCLIKLKSKEVDVDNSYYFNRRRQICDKLSNIIQYLER